MKVLHVTKPFVGRVELPPFGTVIILQPDELMLAEAIIGGLLQMELTDESRQSLEVIFDQVRAPYDKTEVN